MNAMQSKQIKMNKKIPESGNKPGRGNHGIALTTSEVLKLNKLVDQFQTRTAAAIFIGIDRNVLERVLLVSSATRDNVDKIRAAFTKTINNDLYEHSAE